MGFDHDICNTGLGLGLGYTSTVENQNQNQNPSVTVNQRPKKVIVNLGPSLTLGPSDETYNQAAKIDLINKGCIVESGDLLYRQDSGGTSSFSNASVKREREIGSSEEIELERVSSRVISDEDDDALNPKKKLRLTKDQSALLEESFKLHSTLNPKQKQELARKLTLRPRQVEVWFQNRRARTKLKQTEVDCEFLKKCCETLTDENRRLQKELQELKSLKLAQPFYMQLPAATLTMCPSCERVGAGAGSGADKASKNPFSIAPKSHFYNPFTNPSSATC